MEKSRWFSLIFLALTMIILMQVQVHAEEINLGTYNVSETDNKVISTPQDLDTPPEPIKETRVFSASSANQANSISDNYIISKLGQEYFNEHFSFLEVEKRNFVQFYNYDFKYGEYNTKLFVAVSDSEVIEDISHIIKTPQEIVFTDKSASDKSSELELGEPKTISLVYSDKKQTLAWRVNWEHTPLDEEINNRTISGYLLSASNGEVLDTFVYQVDPKANITPKIKSTTNFILPLVLGVLLLVIVILVIIRRK